MIGFVILILNNDLWLGMGFCIWINVLKVFKKNGIGIKYGKVVGILYNWVIIKWLNLWYFRIEIKVMV